MDGFGVYQDLGPVAGVEEPCSRHLLEARQFPSSGSPLAVRHAVAADPTRSRMNVNHPGARLLWAQNNAVELCHPVFFPRERVRRNFLWIVPAYQSLQGLGRLLAIQRV